MKNFIKEIKTRPLGIKLISILFFCIGLFELYRFLILSNSGLLLIITTSFIAAYGILKLKKWARLLALILLVIWIIILIVLAAIMAFSIKTPISLTTLIGISLVIIVITLVMTSVPIVVFRYLTRPKVKEMFK